VDDGLVIDLSPVNGARVDSAKTIAWVGRLDLGMSTTRPTRSASPRPASSSPRPGVRGLTLGGGIGYLTRSVGLSIDNLLSGDVVFADGRDDVEHVTREMSGARTLSTTNQGLFTQTCLTQMSAKTTSKARQLGQGAADKGGPKLVPTFAKELGNSIRDGGLFWHALKSGSAPSQS
jgi:hypothetical protein